MPASKETNIKPRPPVDAIRLIDKALGNLEPMLENRGGEVWPQHLQFNPSLPEGKHITDGEYVTRVEGVGRVAQKLEETTIVQLKDHRVVLVNEVSAQGERIRGLAEAGAYGEQKGAVLARVGEIIKSINPPLRPVETPAAGPATGGGGRKTQSERKHNDPPLTLPNGREINFRGAKERQLLKALLSSSRENSVGRDLLFSLIYPGISQDKAEGVLRMTILRVNDGLAIEKYVVLKLVKPVLGSEEEVSYFLTNEKLFSAEDVLKSLDEGDDATISAVNYTRERLGIEIYGFRGRQAVYLEADYHRLVGGVKNRGRKDPDPAGDGQRPSVAEQEEKIRKFRATVSGTTISFLRNYVTKLIGSRYLVGGGLGDMEQDLYVILKATVPEIAIDFEILSGRGLVEGNLKELVGGLCLQLLVEKLEEIVRGDRTREVDTQLIALAARIRNESVDIGDVIRAAYSHFGLEVPKKYRLENQAVLTASSQT